MRTRGATAWLAGAHARLRRGKSKEPKTANDRAWISRRVQRFLLRVMESARGELSGDASNAGFRPLRPDRPFQRFRALP